MDSAKNGKWIIPFKKFGMFRMKLNIGKTTTRKNITASKEFVDIMMSGFVFMGHI